MKLQNDIGQLGKEFQSDKCNMMQLTRKQAKYIIAGYTLGGTVLRNVDKIVYHREISNIVIIGGHSFIFEQKYEYYIFRKIASWKFFIWGKILTGKVKNPRGEGEKSLL